MSVCKRSLFSVWHAEKDALKKLSALEEFVFSNVIEKSNCTEEECKLIIKELTKLCKRLTAKWRECHRGLERFENKFKVWLDEELVLVCENTQKGAGKKQKEIASDASPKNKRSLELDQQLPIKYTPEEALALYIDGAFTKNSYKLLQAGAKARNCNIYPTYDVLLSAKKARYPDTKRTEECSSTDSE